MVRNFIYVLVLGAPLLAAPAVRAWAHPGPENGVFGTPIPPAELFGARPSAPEAAAPAPDGPLPDVRVVMRALEPVGRDASLALSAQAADVRRCYQRARVRLPDLSGQLTLRLSLSEDGRVQGEVMVDEVGDWRLSSCVSDAMALWVMPTGALTGSADVAVVLRPG